MKLELKNGTVKLEFTPEDMAALEKKQQSGSLDAFNYASVLTLQGAQALVILSNPAERPAEDVAEDFKNQIAMIKNMFSLHEVDFTQAKPKPGTKLN